MHCAYSLQIVRPHQQTDRQIATSTKAARERERDRDKKTERERENEGGGDWARARERASWRGTERERVGCGLQRTMRFRAPSPPPGTSSKVLRLCFERTRAKATVWWALYRDTAFCRVFSSHVCAISSHVWGWHAKCCCVWTACKVLLRLDGKSSCCLFSCLS